MRPGCRIPSTPAGLAVAVLAAGCGSGPPDDGSTTAYLERLGRDTVAVEIVRRTPDRIEGEMLARSQVTRYMTYSFDLDETGAVRRFETDQITPDENPSGPGRWTASIAFEDGRAVIVRETDQTSPDTVSVPVEAPTIPTTGRIPLPIGVLERAIARVEAAEGERASFYTLSPWGGLPQATPTGLTSRGASEYELDFFGNPMVVSVDESGRVTGLSGAETTMKVEVEPIEAPDVAALAADFATRDAEGTGLGAPSPPATVEAGWGGADFTLEYSRPAARGRNIWGGLVPYGAVWRTGANAATHFTTSRDVVIGDLDVPAGTYTLWTTYTPEEAMLIVNSQTQIWGTAYDSAQDLGRTALERESLDEPVERFTIDLEQTDAGGELSFAWDDARYSVPLRVR